MGIEVYTSLEKAKKNFCTIDNLIEIHGNLTQGIQGRNKHLTPSLLQAMLVNLCAYWEAYVEDVCVEGAELLCANINNGSLLSEKMKSKIGYLVKLDKDDKSPWIIYGEGWKNIYLKIVNEKCYGDGINDFGLNTPSYKNVKDLMRLIFDIEKIGDWWTWQGQVSSDAQNKLTALLGKRALIAHGKPVGPLNIGQCRNYYNTIFGIVGRTNDAINHRLNNLCS